MKRITRIFSIMLIAAFIISLFPVVKADAAEKKYKLALTGEYDLGDFTKADYQYTKTLKTVKLQKVEGKNQWNLIMYAGTAVELPVAITSTTTHVEVTTPSAYVYGEYEANKGAFYVSAEDLGQTKTLTNKVLTCKSYNKNGTCLSTLKIVVKILPYSAKLERKTPATAEELYKLEYLKSDYSDFAWKNVIAKYPEYLVYQASAFSSLYECPEALDKEFRSLIYAATTEAFMPRYRAEDHGGARLDLSQYVVSEEDCLQVQELLESLELDKYVTDWEKVLEVQKWVKTNIKYKVQDNPSVSGTLQRRNGDCDCYANLMSTACRLLGIPCYIVVDDKGWSGNGHAWNIVLVDGMWCTMDLTDSYTGFGWVTDKSDFAYKPTMSAFEELVKIFGGTTAKDKGLIWSCVTDNWDQRD